MGEKNKAVRPETIRISLLDTYDSGTGVVLFESGTGDFEGRYHMVPDSDAAVIWVGGAGGGLDGPARGLYPRMADLLKKRGIASLRLDYRRPGDFPACVVDVMAGVEFLALNGHGRVALVGHSFGGAVVIAAGEVSARVTAVAALSSQTHGTSGVSRLTPRPVIFLHGTEDTVLPDTCSRELFRKAGEPKELKLYPGCGHGLDECRGQVDEDLEEWLLRVLMAQHAFHR